MGLEILWFRHVSILLGGFRAVFSLLLSVILIGIGVGSLAAKLIPNFPPASVPLWSVVLAFGFSSGVGLFFGIYPAAKAARLDPIESLRYE
jgi:putative ABC transport system permease protein